MDGRGPDPLVPRPDEPGLVDERVDVGGVVLTILRPVDAEGLIDEKEFARDEFLPYWAELWPAGLALAAALPARLDGLRVVELGAGLGVPSLVAAARGGHVTAVDWAPDAAALLRENARRNGLVLEAVAADWRSFSGSYDLALAADVLYESRNVDALLELLPRLAAQVLLAEPGRPFAKPFLRAAERVWTIEELPDRVYRLTRA